MDIGDRGNQRSSGQRPDARDFLQLLAEFAAAVPGDDLALNGIDLLFELLQMVRQPLNELPKCQRQPVAGILQYSRYTLGNEPDSLRNHEAHLAQKAPDLVGLRRACLDEALPDPVQRQHRLLLDALDRYKPHVWSGHCLANWGWVKNFC